MRNRFQNGHPKYGGRVKGTPNKFSIGRLEAAVAAEHPEWSTRQQLRALATIAADRLEHTQRYTVAEGRALEQLSRVLEKLMPYDHHKKTPGESKENPLHLDVDMSVYTDEEIRAGAALAAKGGFAARPVSGVHTGAPPASLAGRGAQAPAAGGTRQPQKGLRKAPQVTGKARRPAERTGLAVRLHGPTGPVVESLGPDRQRRLK